MRCAYRHCERLASHRVVHEPRLTGNKVPLKLTSLNFEMMAGLEGRAPEVGGLGVGGTGVGAASGAPHSAGTLGGTSGAVGGGGPPAWNPMSAGHDSFFLPPGKQMAMPRAHADQRKGSARVSQTQWRLLDPRLDPRTHAPH